MIKSFDFSAAVGEFIEMDLDDIDESEIKTVINGTTVQHGHANDMIFNIRKVVSFLSHRFTLHKGDLIFTGTPEGVGSVKKGDLIEVYLNNNRLLITDIK